MRSFYIGDNFEEDDSSDGDLAVLVMGGELDYEVSPTDQGAPRRRDQGR